MKEEGLIYDPRSRGFLHLYRDNGRLMIDSQPCQHEHLLTAVAVW